MKEEDKKLQQELVDEIMEASICYPNAILYMETLMKHYELLENNWKELKKYIEKEINDWDNKFVTADRPNECAIASIILEKTLFKMQEIERGKNEENS